MTERISDRLVLLVIALGLVVLLLTIVVGIYLTPRALPNWAENVLVSLGTVAGLKLGDCLGTLVALSTGRSVERLGNRLAETSPVEPSATGKSDDPIHNVQETTR